MRVLGVDPGTIVTGWGVVDCEGARMVRVASGVISAGRKDLPLRLFRIYEGLVTVIREHGPEHTSLERNFLARNVQSAFRLGEARGVAMAASAACGLPLSEYTPMTVKKAVVGYGRADKAQVQAAVARLLGVADALKEDEADALATALCHGLTGDFEARVRTALGQTDAGAGGGQTPAASYGDRRRSRGRKAARGRR